jgi:hypothetical protein
LRSSQVHHQLPPRQSPWLPVIPPPSLPSHQPRPSLLHSSPLRHPPLDQMPSHQSRPSPLPLPSQPLHPSPSLPSRQSPWLPVPPSPSRQARQSRPSSLRSSQVRHQSR